ncbi:hypothetical protein UlMin_042742 [Ulmus minor]
MRSVVVILIALCLVWNYKLGQVMAEPQVPCFFIFGDSLADTGNNNNLPTKAKVDYYPYGVDFPEGPTGRFCNGRTAVDIIAELLGFDNFIPPFASVNGSTIPRGVNYASGSAGILRESGRHLGENIDLGRQLKNHRIILSNLGEILGSKRLAKQHLGKCLYWIGMGNNDYINNYYLPQYYHSSNLYTPQEFASLLIHHYHRQITKLYNYGARKVALVGLGQIGSTPSAMSLYGTNGSAPVNYMNEAVQLFNEKLMTLVDHLNSNLSTSDAKFTYINSYKIGSGDPSSVGFKVWNVGCCRVNRYGQCSASVSPCSNRKEHVFWDSFHPTEAYNLISATQIFKADDPSFAYPLDISHLLHLSSNMPI